jgi:NAD(P)H-dependent flavin oxidoreductase YrpB (nitropropane dioxygenase family)
MFKTRITEMLGIEYPIIQAAMMWVANAELASAASNAGGFGLICALSYSSEDLKQEIRKIKKLTGKPFGVNLTLLPTLKPVNYGEYIDIIIGEGVRFVETAGRNPEEFMDRFNKAGIKVIHKCTAVRFAQKAEKIGCSEVSIDGFEAAGHPGEEDVTSLILIPLTVDEVTIPVIASGGFGDARGLVAALALGAEAVNMGTRFMATKEAPLHPNVKEWLIRASERDTMLLLRAFRNTTRTLKNTLSVKAADMEKNGASIMELAPLIGGIKGKEMLEQGDIEGGLLAAGQVVGLVHDIPSISELMSRLVTEAEQITRRLNK